MNKFKEGVVLLREPFKLNSKLVRETLDRADAREKLESHEWIRARAVKPFEWISPGPGHWSEWQCLKCGVLDFSRVRPQPSARVYAVGGMLKLANGGIGPGMTCDKAIIWKVMET